MAIILFDIDGVLNPFTAVGLPDSYLPVKSRWTTWRIDTGQHLLWLKQLAVKNTLVWCSSWEEDSNDINRFLGLEEWDYVEFEDSSVYPEAQQKTWKLDDVITALVGVEEKVVWLDDEFKPDAHEWAKSRGNTLLIPCDPSVGWNVTQYEQMVAFLDR